MNLDQSLCFSLPYKPEHYFFLYNNLTVLIQVHDFRSLQGGMAEGKSTI